MPITKYWFWLAVLSLGVMLLERLFPWRREQKMLRPELAQDFFWLIFNGYMWGIIAALVYNNIKIPGGLSWAESAGTFREQFTTLHRLPLAAQVVLVLVTTDFVEYLVHNLLHRVGFLWKIHRVHHTIKIMDWIGNFRFNWGEHIVYRTLKFFPLALVGVRWDAALIAAVIATAIGHLNHSNLNISWGVFRYLLNSPRMHIWHHDKYPNRPAGYNFAVVFSFWDWLFATAYMPSTQPAELGYASEPKAKTNGLSLLAARFFFPWKDFKR